MDYGTRMAQDGHRLHVMWVGPYPVVSVDHPDTFKQLIAQISNKPLGQFDGYRMMMPWIGELRQCSFIANFHVHIRVYVLHTSFPATYLLRWNLESL